MRNIETFRSKQMYPYLSLVERKVAEFYLNIDRKRWSVWLKWLIFITFSGQLMVSLLVWLEKGRFFYNAKFPLLPLEWSIFFLLPLWWSKFFSTTGALEVVTVKGVSYVRPILSKLPMFIMQWWASCWLHLWWYFWYNLGAGGCSLIPQGGWYHLGGWLYCRGNKWRQFGCRTDPATPTCQLPSLAWILHK